MPDLKLRTQAIVGLDHSLEVVIEGGIGTSNVRTLKDRLDMAVDPQTAFILIHMANVSFLNSSAFGYLMDLAFATQRRGGGVVLVAVQPKVKVVLNNLGMAKYFRLEASDEEGRAFLRAQQERLKRSPRLVPLDGDDKGSPFPILDAPIRIGSDAKATIRIREGNVQPRHCEVYRSAGDCRVRDLASRSGTFVGDRQVTDEALKPGDVIKVGDVRLTYVAPE